MNQPQQLGNVDLSSYLVGSVSSLTRKCFTPWNTNKFAAGKKHGPAIKHVGKKCPVADGTPVSIWSENGDFWVAVNQPERHDWSRIIAYRLRYPDGALATLSANSVPIPTTRDQAIAMKAVAEAWLADHRETI